jgi:hypothetical protein
MAGIDRATGAKERKARRSSTANRGASVHEHIPTTFCGAPLEERGRAKPKRRARYVPRTKQVPTPILVAQQAKTTKKKGRHPKQRQNEFMPKAIGK